MRVGEAMFEEWQRRGLIRAIRLPRAVRRVRAEEIASLRAGVFTGFAPLREDDDVVRVEHARPIE
jgi:hypothetical protein